jgi:ATP-binding cassette subfamily B protein
MVLLIPAAVLLELAPPFMLRSIVDSHLKAGIVAGLWVLAWWYLAATVAIRGVAFGQAYLTAVAGQRIILRLRVLVAEHLEQLPLSYFDRTPVGDTMSRCTTDVEAVNSLFTSGVIGVVTDLFRIAGVAAAMFALNPLLAAGTMLATPVVFSVTEYFRRNIRRSQHGVRVAIAAINSCLQETWGGMRVLRVFGKEPLAVAGLQRLQAGYHHAADLGAVYNAHFPGVMETLRAVVAAAVLWVAARPVFIGKGLTVGDLAAFALLVGRFFAPIQELSQEYQTIQEALAGVERIAEILSEPVENRLVVARARPGAVRSPEDSAARGRDSAGRLLLEDVTFGYRPGRPILVGVSAAIGPGERVGIVGRTGAGKTSLIHIIAGMYRPWSGRVEVDGIEPIGLGAAERRRVIGVVPQTVHLFAGTLRDNLTMGDPEVPDQKALDVLTLVGGRRFLSAMPAGLNTLLGPGGATLSYGQSQLVCLARALAFDPAVLLLDEPTSGIDSETEALLYRALAEAGRECTLIQVSHRLSGLRDLDRVIILAAGRIVEQGRPEALAGQGGWYRVFSELEAMGWKSGGAG